MKLERKSKGKLIEDYIISKIKEIDKGKDYEVKLPSEIFLTRKFDVSRKTVHDVYERLIERNMVVSKKGSGHFVSQFWIFGSSWSSNFNNAIENKEKIKNLRIHPTNLFKYTNTFIPLDLDWKFSYFEGDDFDLLIFLNLKDFPQLHELEYMNLKEFPLLKISNDFDLFMTRRLSSFHNVNSKDVFKKWNNPNVGFHVYTMFTDNWTIPIIYYKFHKNAHYTFSSIQNVY